MPFVPDELTTLVRQAAAESASGCGQSSATSALSEALDDIPNIEAGVAMVRGERSRARLPLFQGDVLHWLRSLTDDELFTVGTALWGERLSWKGQTHEEEAAGGEAGT